MAANKAREPNRKIRVSRGQAAAGMDCPYLPSGKSARGIKVCRRDGLSLIIDGQICPPETYFAYSSATNLRRASRERFTFSVEMQ